MISEFRPRLPARYRRTRLLTDQRGLSTVEYVIILVLVAAVAIGAWRLLGGSVERALGRSTSRLEGLGDLGQDQGFGAGQPGAGTLGGAKEGTGAGLGGGSLPSTGAGLGAAGQPTPGAVTSATGAAVSNTGSGATIQPAVFVAPQVGGASASVTPVSVAALVPATPAALTAGTAGGGPANERAQSVTTPLSTASSGLGTRADYSVGPAKHPDIHHDNGFLQNPKDPNDPVPQATRSPTMAERKAFLKQVLKAEAGLAAVQTNWPKGATPKEFQHFLDLPDGIEMYHHFLTAHGADRTFSYDKYVQDDPSGKTTLRNAINDTQQGAEQLYREMLAKDPSLAGKPVTFEMTGSPIVVGSPFDATYPYAASENWQKAIGGHTIWNSASVTVTPSTVPGEPAKFSMEYTLHGEDRYNFNPGMKDIATGQPDSDNGRFEVTGLGQQFTNYATLERDVSWQSGSASSTTQTESSGR